jgi:pyruvate formate lyase activating enzyme
MDQTKHELEGLVFKISRCSTEDGPGIRTTVFLQGCPLSCLWCHSPQSQSKSAILVFYANRCIHCSACREVCPQQAQIVTVEERSVLWERCNNCGDCTKICPSQALRLNGEYLALNELINIIKRDSIYYKNSGGGVTFSGGEPTLQHRFLLSCLKKCHENGINTALETCGFTKWSILESMLPFINLFLYDIKHMDSMRHRQLTGVSNELILKNLRELDKRGKSFWIRLPIIQGYNDLEENIIQTAEFVKTLNNLQKVSLLAYNTAAPANYEAIGRKYILGNIGLYPREKVDNIIKIFSSFGIKAEFAR